MSQDAQPCTCHCYSLLNQKSSHFPFTLMEASLFIGNLEIHTLRKAIVEGSLHASFCAKYFFNMHFVI